MELTSARADPAAPYTVVDQIFYDDRVVGVLEHSYVLGTVHRASITAVRFEGRSTFKHPVIGLVLGLAFAGVPVQSVLGDPLHLWWLTLASPMRVLGSVFMLFVGTYLLWEVIRRRDEPWVVFVLGTTERAFPLARPLSAPALQFLQSFNNAAAPRDEPRVRDE